MEEENQNTPLLGIDENESNEFREISKIKKFLSFTLKPIIFIIRIINKSAGMIALAALIAGGIGIYMGIGPYNHFKKTDPTNDGFVQPRSIAGLVDRVQASTVTVFCDYTKDSYMQGSGWAITLPTTQQSKFPYTLITNHHVIKKCLGGSGKVAVKTLGGKEFSAYVDRWDVKNDLAVIGTTAKVQPLRLSQWMPYAGYWVMAVGTADGYEGSVAFGNVLNTTDSDILITAPISHGNSGGPLVDNEGHVIGTNSWLATGEQYNGAVSLDAMCEKIMKCDGKFYWNRN